MWNTWCNIWLKFYWNKRFRKILGNMEIWFKYKKLVRDYVRYDAKNKLKKKKKTQKKIKVATS